MSKRTLAILSLLFLFSLPSWAQDYPKIEIFGGYSYESNEVLLRNERSDLNGFNINAAYNFHPNFGVVFDFAGHFGNESIPNPSGTGPSFLDIGVDNYTYMGGPRYTFRNFERFTPFAHALFGVQNTRSIGASETNFAWALGGGFDINISDHFAVRPVQVEYLGVNFDDTVNFGATNNFRYSGGVVFKW